MLPKGNSQTAREDLKYQLMERNKNRIRRLREQSELEIKTMDCLPDGLMALYYKFASQDTRWVSAYLSAKSLDIALEALNSLQLLPVTKFHGLGLEFIPDPIAELSTADLTARGGTPKSEPLGSKILLETSAGIEWGQNTKLVAWIGSFSTMIQIQVSISENPVKLFSEPLGKRGAKSELYTWRAKHMTEQAKALWPTLFSYLGTANGSGTYIGYDPVRAEGTANG